MQFPTLQFGSTISGASLLETSVSFGLYFDVRVEQMTHLEQFGGVCVRRPELSAWDTLMPPNAPTRQCALVLGPASLTTP